VFEGITPKSGVCPVIAGDLSQSLFENQGSEFRLQAAARGNRLKAELRTPNDALPAIFQTGSQWAKLFRGVDAFGSENRPCSESEVRPLNERIP
jgi:hypothetical protein